MEERGIVADIKRDALVCSQDIVGAWDGWGDGGGVVGGNWEVGGQGGRGCDDRWDCHTADRLLESSDGREEHGSKEGNENEFVHGVDKHDYYRKRNQFY